MSSEIRPGDHLDEPRKYAPKWVREGKERPENVVPMRLPDAPQLVMPEPERPRGRRLNPFEGDIALRRLLQRQSLDPQSVPEPPMREARGVSFGMIGRLLVAITVAASAAFVVVGVIPTPFKQNIASREAISPPSSSSSDAGTPERAVVKSAARLLDDRQASAKEPVRSDITTDGAVTASAATGPAVDISPPSRVATQAIVAPSSSLPASASAVAPSTGQSGPPPRVLEADEISRLNKRGEELFAQGDIASARLMLQRAAEAGDARAALALGATFDPNVLKQLGVVGFKPDLARAREWYEKAAQFGSADASRRLALLPQPDR